MTEPFSGKVAPHIVDERDLPVLPISSPEYIDKRPCKQGAAFDKAPCAQYQAECESIALYEDCLHQLKQRDPAGPELSARLAENYRQSCLLAARFPCDRTQLYQLLIGLRYEAYELDLRALLLRCQLGRVAFEAKPFVPVTPLRSIYYYSLACLAHLQQYEDGCKIAEKGLALTIGGSLNWFRLQELYCLLHTRTERYAEAYSILQQSIQHPAFSRLHDQTRAAWMLLEAMVLFALYVRHGACSLHQLCSRLEQLLLKIDRLQSKVAHTSACLLSVRLLLAIAKKDRTGLRTGLDDLQSQDLELRHIPRILPVLEKMIRLLLENGSTSGATIGSFVHQFRLPETKGTELSQYLLIIPPANFWVMLLKALDVKYLS